MNTGLFFGSFNPIHTGHLIIANFMLEFTAVEKVWFVVSPQNPFKPPETLAPDYHRLEMVRLATADNPDFTASDVEFSLPRPSYTINTLNYLANQFPDHRFYLIMGLDNLKDFDKWKNHKDILGNFPVLIYRRACSNNDEIVRHHNIHYFDTPYLDISSTYIRDLVKKGRSIRYLVPDRVIDYIHQNQLYR